MMKKKAAAGFIALCMTAAITACGNSNMDSSKGNTGNESDQVSGDKVEIVWLTTGTEEDFTVPGKVNYECIKTYNESQDKIHVTPEYYANQNDLFEVIQMKLAAGTSEYDVVNIDSPMVPAYAYHQWLLPVDPYFTEEELADFTETSLENASYDGKLYAPALQNSTVVLCYNTKLLEEAGVTLRENNTENRLTWEEVTGYAQQVLDKLDPDRTKGITGIEFNQVGRTYQMNMLPNSMGGEQIGADGFTGEQVLDSQPWIDALTWYQEQVNAGICSKGIKPMEAPDNFYSDKSVFYVASVAAIGVMENKMDHFDYTCVPAFEGYEDKVATPCGSWNMGINIGSEHPEEAADFVKFMTLGKGNELRFQYSSNVPARKSLLEDMMSGQTEIPHYMEIAGYEVINTAKLRAKTPGYNEYSAAVDAMWEDVRNGGDIQEVVQMTIQTINSSMQKYK